MKGLRKISNKSLVKPGLLLASFVFFVSLVGVGLSKVAFQQQAQSATLTAGASSGTINQNSQFQVTVYVNTNTAASIGQAYVTYDTAKLELVGIPSYAGSPLDNDSPDSVGGTGYFQVSRYKGAPPYPSGSFPLATFTFRAKLASGNATIGITAANSAVYSAVSPFANILASASGVSVNFAAPAAAPTTPSTSTGNQSSGSTKTSTGTTGSSTNPAAGTPPQATPPSTNNTQGTPTSAETVTPEQAAAAAETTQERTLAAQAIGQQQSAKAKKSGALIASLAAVVTLAAIGGFLLIRARKQRTASSVVSLPADTIQPPSNDVHPPANPSGTVITPETPRSPDQDKGGDD